MNMDALGRVPEAKTYGMLKAEQPGQVRAKTEEQQLSQVFGQVQNDFARLGDTDGRITLDELTQSFGGDRTKASKSMQALNLNGNNINSGDNVLTGDELAAYRYAQTLNPKLDAMIQQNPDKAQNLIKEAVYAYDAPRMQRGESTDFAQEYRKFRDTAPEGNIRDGLRAKK